jgi:APA family basic amino acid/polyamine antiporter
LTALGVGAIIGTGIYTLTGVGAGIAGPGVILAFAVAGIVCACAALLYAEMSTMMPAAGSAYTYTYAVIGEAVAWIVGWSLILEYAVGAATVAVGWSGYFGGMMRSVGIELPQAILAGPHLGGVVNLPAVIISLIITGMLVAGTRESATFNIALVLIKMVALTVFIIFAGPAFDPTKLDPFMPFGFLATNVDGKTVGVMAAAAIVFFAYFGFDAVSTAAEEAIDPGRDLVIGIIGSLAVCTVIYMLVAAVAVGAVPFGEFAASPEPLAYILRSLGFPYLGAAIGIAAIIALPSVILVLLYGQSRIFFVMARDGLLPHSLSTVHATRGTPMAMTLITGGSIAVVSGFLRLDEIAALANSGTLLAFIAVAACTMILRVRRPELPRIYATPAVWIVGPLAIGGCLFLFVSLPVETMLRFVAWNALGFVIYLAYGIRKSRLALAQ